MTEIAIAPYQLDLFCKYALGPVLAALLALLGRTSQQGGEVSRGNEKPITACA